MTTVSATSAEPISIEDAIARVRIWRGETVRFERIAAGITNLNWLITLPERGDVYFLKIHGPGTDRFIDRKLAHEAATKVSETGYAPRLLFYDAEKGIEVYEFLHGYRSCTLLDILRPAVLGGILSAFKSVHSTQRLSVVKTGFDQLREHLDLLKSLDAKLPGDFGHLLWQTGRAERAMLASGMDTCACYNDSYVSNFMIDDAGRVKIVDWEYATGNDPYWDLALLTFEGFFLDEEKRHEILEAYDGAWREDTAARIMLYNGVSCMKWGLWALYQDLTSTIGFDFGKYAELLFLRGRMAMLMPQWERALSKV